MDDDFDDEPTPGRRARKIDLLVLALDFAHDLAAAAESALDLGLQVVCQHANYLRDREQFREEAVLELETILGENE